MTEKQRRESTQTILHATRRLSNLVVNMLKLNKLENQAIQPAPKRFDLCAQLSECALQFENSWEKKQIEFEADMEDWAYIEGDEELLALVWTNLISNAIKMTPEIIKRIFDKFYQEDTSHSTEGNGLGLALVRRILELSDGTIAVKSTPGRGSVFTVRLPVAPLGEETLH